MATRWGVAGCRRCSASLHQQHRPAPDRCLPLRPSPPGRLHPPQSRLSYQTQHRSTSAHRFSTATLRPSPDPPHPLPTLSTAQAETVTPPSPSSSSRIDPLWLCHISDLRSLLRFPLPLSSLLLITHRFRTTFRTQCTLTDTSLLLHQLALHHLDTAHLHSITSAALLLYDDTRQRRSTTHLPPSALRDLLTLASLTGEARLCNHLVRHIAEPTVEDLNLQLWGSRGEEEKDVWELWSKLEALTAPAEGQEGGKGGVRGLKATPESVLVLLHVCSHSTRWLRFDCWLIMRGEHFFRHHLSADGSSSPSLSLLLEHVLLYIDFVSSHQGPLCSRRQRSFWSSALRKLAHLHYGQPPELEQWKLQILPSTRFAVLYRIANALGVGMSAKALRLLLQEMQREAVDADAHKEEEEGESGEGEKREAQEELMETGEGRGEQQQTTAAAAAAAAAATIATAGTAESSTGPSLGVAPTPSKDTTLAISWALFRDGLRAELRLRGEAAEGANIAEADAMSRKESWQAVLAAYDRQVGRGHPPVELADSFKAIDACYRGRHWQRAVEVLVMPLYTLFNANELQLLTSPGGSAPADSPSSSPALPAPHDEAEYIALSPITGRWSGPQSYRPDFALLLDKETWREASRDPYTELRTQSWSSKVAAIRHSPNAKPIVARSSSPSSILVPAVASPPMLCSSVLHFAFCIAAMDEAGNAESLAKADRLHAIALHHFPFLFHLYHPHSRTIHLVHPPLPPPFAAINAFVHHPDRTRDRLWALLYLVWRLLRRREMGGERSEVGEVWVIEQLYEEAHSQRPEEQRDGPALAVSKRGGGDDGRPPMQLRIEGEKEAAVLRGVLREGPWSLKGDGGEWPLRVVDLALTLPAYPLWRSQQAQKSLAVPAFWTKASKGTPWVQGWQSLLSTFSAAQSSSQRHTAPCLIMPTSAWEESVRRPE